MSAQSPYQGTLTATMDALGWQWNHTRPVYDRAAQAYITPTTAKGWPDLAAVHPRTGVMLFAELKGKCPAPKRGWSTSDVKPDQMKWLRFMHTVPCAAAVVLRPTDDWVTISGWLATPETLVSGYGWLPPEEHHRIWTSRSIAALLR